MGSRKFTIIAVGAALVLLGLIGRAWLFPETETQKIERVLRQVATTIESKKAKAVGGFLMDDFSADPHQIDREAVVGHLRGFFLQVTNLRVSLEYLKHETEKLPRTATEARVLVVVKTTGTIDGQAFAAFGGSGTDALLLVMRKKDGDWRIAKGKYLDVADPAKAFEKF